MGVSPSESDAVPEQISKVDVTAVVGEILALLVNVGLVFATVSLADEVAVPPSLSAMVAKQ